MEEQIERILAHREQLRILRDPEDGYYNVDAYNSQPFDSREIDFSSQAVGFGHTLWSALSDLEGSIMEFDQRV